MSATKQQSRLSGAVAVMIAQAMVLLFGFGSHIIIGVILGRAQYGIYGIVLNIQTMFGLLLTLGVPAAVSRYVAQNEKSAQSILAQAIRLQLIIASVVAGLVLILSPVFAIALQDTSLTPIIAIVAAVIFSQALYPIYVQYFAGLHRFNKQALLTGLYATLKLVGALALIFFIGVYGAFAGFAIGGVIAALIGWAWAKQHGGSSTMRLPRKAFLSFASIYVLILFGLQLLISLDLFMVKALLQDNAIAGDYNAAVTLSRIPYMMLQALGFILLPSVSMLTKPGASHDEAAAFIKDTIRYLIAIIVPGVALAATTSKALLGLFYPGGEFLAAASSLTILMVGLGALAFYLLLANIVAGAGKANVGLYITIGLLVVSGGLGFILIPAYGLIGAAWQTTLASVIGLIILGWYTFRTFSIPVPVRSTVNILIASAVAVVPTYFFDVSSLTLIPLYVISGLVYVVVLLLLGEVTPADRSRLASLPVLNKFMSA